MRSAILILLIVLQAVLAFAGTEAEEKTVKVSGGQLGGTLLLPEGKGPWPAVLIIPGSGPVDRDGNLPQIPGKNNSLLQLAEALATEGVASLRVDKRGVGGSLSAGLSESTLRFDDFINDAVLWIKLLQDDGRFSSVTVAGHSQGSQVGMNAAWLAGADGFVSLAGPGRPILDVLREQLAESLPVRTRVKANQVMAELEAGRRVDEPPTELTILFRTSVQGFLISWQQRNPKRDLARLSCPVTIVQGLNDLQVKEEDALLLHEAKPTADLFLLDGISHLFKPIEGDNPIVHQMALGNPELRFSPQAIAAVLATTQKADAFHLAWEGALDRLLIYNQPQASPWNAGAEGTKPMGRRVAAWAEDRRENSSGYLFGLAEGGYVSEGQIEPDGRHDCVSYMYRSTELARSGNERESLSWALRTRFAGAHPDSVVDADGRVNYDRPEHLDFSLDMIRSGNWGYDVSTEVGSAVVDNQGTSRYEAGSFAWVPADSLDTNQLQSGDIVWFVLNPEDKKARQLRDEYGLVIGHIGVLNDAKQLLHAASKDLPGQYEGGQVVSVDLMTYLSRVDRYAGVMVTRLR